MRIPHPCLWRRRAPLSPELAYLSVFAGAYCSRCDAHGPYYDFGGRDLMLEEKNPREYCSSTCICCGVHVFGLEVRPFNTSEHDTSLCVDSMGLLGIRREQAYTSAGFGRVAWPLHCINVACGWTSNYFLCIGCFNNLCIMVRHESPPIGQTSNHTWHGHHYRVIACSPPSATDA